ncbi:polycystin-1-like protein 2 [Ptychodera flava]|uniref:polycystin-1-like protein 2 n=1 Tax=Ptychodera flava TaxID=63121 RepID=UPI00396A23DE
MTRVPSDLSEWVKRWLVCSILFASLASETVSGCGGTRYLLCGTTLMLTSPGHPSNYPRNQDCSWSVFADEGSFRITFIDFKTQQNADILSIGEAGSTTPAETYSGNDLPSPWDSLSNSIWLNFTSDNSVNRKGFSLAITSRTDGACKGHVECGNSYRLTSPNFPENYENGDQIEWRLTTDASSTFTIKFAAFKTKNLDILEIGNGDETNADVTLGGGSLPNDWSSEGNSTWIKWTTNSVGADEGWDLTINSVPSEICELYIPCGGDLRLRSPNFPEEYNHDDEIEWHIDTNGDFFTITFVFFKTENNDDFLRVATLGPDAGPWIADRSYTGSNLPDAWQSDNSSIAIKWTTDQNGLKKGWHILVEAFPVDRCPAECESNEFECGDGECLPASWECDGTNDCTDSSDENGCPTGQESSDSSREFLFSIGSESLDSEGSGSLDCEDDEFVCDSCLHSMHVCDGYPDCLDFSDEDDCPTGSYGCLMNEWACGDGDCIPIYWRCDAYIDCEDESDEVGCPLDHFTNYELSRHLDSTLLSTTNYPDDYVNDENWVVFINTTTDLYLAVHFIDFETDENDVLTIGLGANASDSSSVIRTVSGSQLPWDFTSYSNELWMTWVTDESKTKRGISILVEALECGGWYFLGDNQVVNVTSPTFPNLYENGENCFWFVTAPEGSHVTMYFLDFESSAGDFVRVGDGHNPSPSSTVFTHSGVDTLPHDWTSEGNRFWMNWKTSTSSQRRTGWRLVVEGLRCGGRYYIDDVKGYEDLETPNYPNKYDNFLLCVWLVTTSAGNYLTTHFHTFDTEHRRDVVLIGTGHDPTNTTSMVIVASGGKPPDDWLSPTDKIWVRFRTNPAVVARGFSLRVQYVSSAETTTEEPPPTQYEVTVSCISNCGDVVTAGHSLSARALCSNCPRGKKMTFLWSLTYTASTLGFGVYEEVSMERRFTSTGVRGPFISINGGRLGDGYTYKLSVNLTDDKSGYGGDTWRFVTNAPPTSGNCSVTPETGYTLDTEFTVQCENWVDDHMPIRYLFFSKPKGPGTLKSLLFSGKRESTPPFLLSVGKEAFNYEVDIIVDIVDSYNSATTEVHTITVEPLSLDEEELTQALKNMTTGDNNMLGNLLNSGDKEGAVSLVITVASVLNDGSSKPGPPKSRQEITERKEIRKSIIKDLKTISRSVESVDQVSQMASALLAMTSVPDELSEDSQVDTAVAMEALSGSLVTMKNETETSILSSASAITEAIGNVLSVATDSSADDTGNAVSSSTSSTVVKSTVSTVNSVSQAVLSKRVPGQPPVVMNTSSLTVQLQRDEPSDLGGSTLSSDVGDFQLPAADTLLGGYAGDSFIDTQFLSFTTNPFNWDNSSQYISSSVISLSFADSNSSNIAVSGLSEDIVINLPILVDLPEPDMLNTSSYSYSDSDYDDDSPSTEVDLYFYEVQIPTAYTAIHFRIFTSESWDDLNYTLYFQRGQAPSRTSYNFSGSLPNTEYENDGDLDGAVRAELKNTFFVPSDMVDEAGSYFIGIEPVQGDLNISVQIFTSGCRYWDEVEEKYKGDGCMVSPESSSMTTICKCSHLTSFGSDFFVPPNSIDFSTVFGKFSSLSDNASVFSTIIVILGIYIIAVVWARREDKKDIAKWGVTPLPDNRLGHAYLYQITVYTGMKSGAGTKSRVFIILRGKRGETHVRRLKDTKRKVFRRGSVCSFLMAAPESLGDLVSVTVWHDNSGKGQTASWYLSKIVVHDVQTKEATYFLCERWLAVEKEDGQIYRELSVSTEADVVAFNHLFVSHAKKDLTDGHIWFSFISRPTRSHFTRVQRLTCCLSLLYTTMIANCMWFKGEDEESTGQMIKIGPFTLAWQSIYVGIMGSLVVFPVNVLLIQIFRKSRPKDHSAVSTAAKVVTDSSTPYDKHNGESDKDIHEILRNIEEGDAYYRRAIGRMTSRVAPPYPNLQPPEYTAVGYNKVPASEYPAVGKRVTFADLGNGGWPQAEKRAGVVTMDGAGCESPSSTSDTSTSKTAQSEEKNQVEERKKKKKEKKPFACPYWFIYIGYCVAFLSSATSAFFTVLYSLEWGHEKSVEWLVSFLMSFFQSVIVIQPVKVLCIAVLLAFIFKRYDSDVEVHDVKPQEDEEYLHKTPMTNDNFKPLMQPVFEPPDPDKLEEIRLRREKDIKMMAIIKEITIYVFYMLMVCSLAYANRDPNAFYLHQSIEQQLFQNYYYAQLEGGHTYYGSWMTRIVIPSLYPTSWYNGNQTLSLNDRKFISDLVSYRVGPPRLRHLRIKPGLCQVLKQFSTLMSNCYAEYSFGNEEERSFNENWSGVNGSADEDSLWRYHTSSDLDGVPIYGVRRPFYGGGYIAELGSSLGEAEAKWQQIWNARWFDRYTRALLLEFPLYNANVNLFSMVTLLVEFPATGAALVFPKISILRLYNYVGHNMVFNLICEFAFVAFIIYYLVHAILQIKKTKIQYFKSFFNWIEMFKIILSVAGIALHLYKNIYLKIAQKSLSSAAGGSGDFVNLQEIAVWDELFLYVVSAVVFMSFLKFIHILRFNRNISLFGKTLRRASGSLVSFGIMFFVVSMSFSQLFHLVVGSSVSDYRTLITSAETLLSVTLGIFDYHATVKPQPILAPIIFFAFNFVSVFVLMTVFIAIIIYALEEAKAEPVQDDYEMYEFIKTNVKDIATGCFCGDDDDSDDEEDYGNTKQTEKGGQPMTIPVELCDIGALELRITWLDNWLLRALKQYGIDTTKSAGSYDKDGVESYFPPLPRRCQECRLHLKPVEIERHLIFICPKMTAERKRMFRRMVEAIGDIESRVVRTRARSWWKFYRDNSKTLQLTTVDELSGKFQVCRQSMVFYDLPARVKRTLSAVVTDFLEESLLLKWFRLKQKSAGFDLQDFLV